MVCRLGSHATGSCHTTSQPRNWAALPIELDTAYSELEAIAVPRGIISLVTGRNRPIADIGPGSPTHELRSPRSGLALDACVLATYPQGHALGRRVNHCRQGRLRQASFASRWWLERAHCWLYSDLHSGFSGQTSVPHKGRLKLLCSTRPRQSRRTPSENDGDSPSHHASGGDSLRRAGMPPHHRPD